MMIKSAFILFLKYPERGKVKTRLADVLGDDLACELYTFFLEDLAAVVREVKAEPMIVYSGPAGAVFSDFPGVACIRQRGSDIGERMYFAFQDVFARGFERCVLMGSDIPDLPSAFVNDALAKLDSADVVLGPSTDGGYYLVGCNRDSLRRTFFSHIPWSTAGVFSETRRRIMEAGLISAELPEWSDIDDPDDLQQYLMRNENQTRPSRVMNFLKSRR
ncbi:MAG: TIGR04282 family arsenosugar biosynthesis glycosyltransferase [Deltaproteobacteria bacterium]